MTTGSVAVAALPAACAGADAALRVVLDDAACAGEWEASTRQAMLTWVAKQRDLLAVVEGRVLTAERNVGTWSLRGDRDLAGFVGRTARTGRGAGMAAVGQAGTLAAMPVVAQALVEGPVTATHVAQITRATAASPVLAAEVASPAGQAQLVQLAGRLDGGEFGKALAQLSASLDPASRQRAHDEQRASRSFAWTHTPSGTLVKGRLDSVAGHMLAKAIDALCPRPTAEDDRSREMRQADALLALVQRAAADKTTTPGALAPVQAILTFTQDTWTALRALEDQQGGRAGRAQPDPERRPDPGSTSCGGDPVPGSTLDVLDRLRGVDPVVDETGQSWPASEVARALCDCALTRAVIGAGDVELNLGRDARAFTRRHWLALYAAGITSCAVPGCGMPLAYCQLHHLAWWHRDNGATTMANCAAYCSFHHHEIHRLGILVTRMPDGSLEHHHPDGRIYGAAPPGAPPGPPSGAPPGSPRDAAPGSPTGASGSPHGATEDVVAAGGGAGIKPRTTEEAAVADGPPGLRPGVTGDAPWTAVAPHGVVTRGAGPMRAESTTDPGEPPPEPPGRQDTLFAA